MRNQSKPKQRTNSKSKEKSLKKSNSIVPIAKKQVNNSTNDAATKNSKKPISSHNTAEDMFSPKTVSYHKVMQQHGKNIDSDNSFTYDTYNEDKKRKSHMTPVQTRVNHDLHNFRKILDDYEYLSEENSKLRAKLEAERSKTLKLEERLLSSQPKLSSNIKEIDSLKEKNNALENELENLKSKSANLNNKMKEKVMLMMQIFRKNVKKITNLAVLIGKDESHKTPSRELLLKEFNQALDSFNKVLNNDKVKSVFEKDITDLENELNEEVDLSHYEIIKKLESKCKKLEKERQKHYEAAETYMLKFNDIKINFEDAQRQITELKNANNELDKGYMAMKEENDLLRKELTLFKEKTTDYEDKIKGLTNELQFKSSKLDYYTTLKNDNNTNNFNSTVKSENQVYSKREERDGYRHEVDDPKAKLKSYKDYLGKDLMSSTSDINVFSSNEEISVPVRKNYGQVQSEVNISKASSLKNDIDYLDNEINQLQGKLRMMIEKK